VRKREGKNQKLQEVIQGKRKENETKFEISFVCLRNLYSLKKHFSLHYGKLV